MADFFDKAATAYAESQAAPTEGAPQSEGAPTVSDQAPVVEAGQAPSTAPQILELDKHERVKWNGQEWSLKDLQSSVLRQSDYTRKTQELAKEREFVENLPYDLARVQQDGSLVQAFKQIYPEKFHALVKQFESQATTQTSQPVESKAGIDPVYLSRLEKIESSLMEKEVQAIESSLDNTMASMKTKYPMADEESVLARASNLLESKSFADLDKQGRITEAGWEKIFKAVGERNQKMAETHYKSLVDKQTKASAKAKDGGRGSGEAPGAAPKKMLLKDAEKYALEQIAGQKF